MAVTRGQHLIGKRLGSCTLENLLGYGGSSAVFLAQEDNPARKVAVKVFMPRVGLDSSMLRDFYRRFLREAEAASKLDHPNILSVYSYGEEDGIPYIIMPYMSGGTLAEHMSRCGPLSWLEVQWYLEQLAAALDYAHKQGCVHCDVKPANILLDSEGHILLSDFGIARSTGTENTESHGPGGVVMGTPDYISPEQALGHTLDGRSDIYSLAVTVFCLLTRRLPFNADSPIALALLHVHEPPPALTAVRADITPALDHVVRQAMAKNPANRFQSASAFSTAFATAVLASTAPSSRFAHEQLREEDYEHHVLINEQVSAFVIDKPVIHVKPIKPTNHGYRHLLVLMLATCLVIASTIGSTFNAVKNGLAELSGSATTITPGVAPVDLLTYGDRWPTSKTFFFQGPNQSYHIVNTSASQGALALYYHHPFTNFRLTVTIQEMQKSSMPADYCGIILRANPDQSHYYLFEVAPSQGKHYAFLRYDQQWTTVANGTAPSLVAGTHKKNTITIEVHSNLFSLRINGTSIAQPLSDPAPVPLASGLIGLYVEDQGAEVAFSQLYVDTEK